MANQHELVCQAIQAQLQTIVAGVDNYAYTPDKVIRVAVITENWVPDPQYRTVYYFSPESEIRQWGPSSCEATSLLTVGILACKRLDDPSENPAEKETQPERWQLANEMFADITQCIYTDPTFDGTARHLLDRYTIIADYQRWLEGWAMVFVRFVVQYATDRPGR